MLKVQACDISDKSGDDFNFVSKPKSAKSEIKLSNKSPNKAPFAPDAKNANNSLWVISARKKMW